MKIELSLFYLRSIQPNISFNKSLSENAYNESMSKISNFRGMIDKQTLIISKGEVVDKEKVNNFKVS